MTFTVSEFALGFASGALAATVALVALFVWAARSQRGRTRGR